MDPITNAAAAMFAMGLAVGLLSAVAITFAIWVGWVAIRRWGPPRLRGPAAGFRTISILASALVIVVPAGCVWVFVTPTPQPASAQQLAAVEVPLRTPADHADLLAMLQRYARDDGLHVDDGTAQWIQFRRDAPDNEPPSARNVLTKSIYASVWRGADDHDLEMDVDDGGHLGRAWVTFLKGEQPALATRTRVRLLADLKRRWPDARDVPIMPNGALPSADDLIWSGTSYTVKPDRLADYAPQGG